MRRLGPVLALILASVALLADDKDAARKRIETRKRPVDADQAEKRVALAEWCANKGLLKEAREEYDKAIALVGGNEKWTRDRDNLQVRGSKKNRPAQAEDRAECEKSRQKLSDAYGKLYGELATQAKEAGLDDLAGELQAEAAGKDPPKEGPSENGRKGPPAAAWTPAQVAERINWYRKLAGVPAAALDERLSWGAQQHANYLHVNRIKPGVDLHTELDIFPGYSPEGNDAAQASDICWGPPANAVDELMAELFHRIPVLRPGLERIGVGIQGPVAVIDLQTGVTEPDVEGVIVFPVPDQTDVPTGLGSETPDPLPSGSPRDAGYPVTLTQYDRESKIAEATATLVDGRGKPVEVHLSTPEAPADPERQLNTVAMVPVHALASATKYTATVKCEIKGVPFEKTWSFTTK